MEKCLNCHKDLRDGLLLSDCPYCAYPLPAWSNTAYIICWGIVAFIFLLAGIAYSWFFSVIAFFYLYSCFSLPYKRKNGTFEIKQAAPAADSTSKPKSAEDRGHPDVNDSSYYDSGDFTDGNLEFNDFDDELTTIWGEERCPIAFEFINSARSSRRREMLLDKVLINAGNEVYFSGYCFDNNQDHIFSVACIISPIEYAGQEYNLAQFLTYVLGLEEGYVAAH